MIPRFHGFLLFFVCLFGVIVGKAQLVPGIKANGKILNQGDVVTTCIGTSVIFESTAQGYTTMQWRFNNGTPVTGISNYQSIYYGVAGTDTTWQVITTGSDRDSIYVLVHVTDVKPIAAFLFTPDGECGNITVNFTNNSSGTGVSSLWNFEVGGTSTDINPAYQFLNAIGTTGTVTYPVKLIVTNDQLCKDSITKTVTIKKVPDASLGNGRPGLVTFGPFNNVQTFRHCENLPSYEFWFTNASTTSSIITSYTIKWGDSSPDSIFTSWAAGALSKHTFQAGKTTMQITAIGSNGCIGIKTYVVFLGTTPAAGIASLGNTSICAPNLLSFPITNYQNNALGTTYTFNVNDGTVAKTYQHPPPDNVDHIFTTGSCGNVSGSYTNAFQATLFIENPCGSTTGSVVPIYVSGKPIPSFVISPSNTVCTNNTVLFNNNSSFGGQIVPTGGTASTCTNTGKQVWSVSPATGYTIVSSTLGSVNGNPGNSASWSVGTSYIYLNFTQPGTYTIKLYVANDLCGIDSTTRTVCVRLPPTASFTLNKHEGCSPDTATITTTSVVGGCLGDTYNWAITYSDPQGCGGTSSYSFINGTSTTSKNPQIKFINPGRYIMGLTVSANASGCTSAIVRDTFYIKAKPKVTINLISAICIGNSISPTANAANNCYSTAVPTYNWTFTNGTPSTINTLIPGNISYSLIGIQPITLDMTNECGTTTATAMVNVTNTPVANAGTDKNICSGTAVPMGTTATTGYTYAWTPTTGLSNAAISNPTATLTYNGPSADTTYQYVVKTSAGATCFSTDTILITVRWKPNILISPYTSICSGTSTILWATGATAYVWTPATGLNPTSTDTVTASPTITTIYTVTGSFANNCSTSASTTVTVVTTPVANAGIDKSICSGVQTTLGTAPTTGYVYAWTPATGLSSTNTSNPIATLTYTGPGTDTTYQYVVKASVGSTCFSTDTVLVTVKLKPTITILPSASAICAGGNMTLMASGADTYAWSPAATLNNANTATVIASPTITTTYFVTGTLINNCSTTAQATVTVNNFVKTDAGPDTTVCKGSATIQLSGSPISGAWSPINLVTPTGIFNPQAVGNGVYKLYFIAGSNGCNSTDSMIATVIDAPVANAGNDSTVCASNSTIALHGLPIGGTWSGSTLVTPSGIFTTSVPSVYALYYTYGSGSCIGRDTVIITVNTGVSNNIIAGNQSICINSQPGIISGQTAVGGNGTPTYKWQQSTDSTTWTDISGATLLNYAPPILTVNTFYRRLAVTSLCSGAQGSISNSVKITITPNAKALFNPTVTKGCTPFKITPAIINLTPFPANDGQYNWYVNGILIGSGQTFPGYTMTNTGDSISIKLVAVSLGGCKNDSMQVGFTTVVKPVPAFTQSDSVGCGPLSITFKNLTPNAANYSYQWNFGNGQTSILQQPSAIVFATNPTFQDTIYNIKFKTISQCDTITLTTYVRVKSKPKALFTPDKSTGCSPLTVTFTNTSLGSVTMPFVWDFGDGSALLSSNAATVLHTYNVGKRDTFKIKLIATNDCGKDTLVYAIVVQPNTIKLAFAINGNDRYGCLPHTVRFINNTSGANTFVWDFGDGSALLTTIKGIDTIQHVYTLAGNFTTTLKASNSCSDTTAVQVSTTFAKPNVSINAFPLTACIGDSIHFINQSDSGVSNLWYFGDGTTSFNRSPAKAYTLPGNFGVKYIASLIYTNGTVCADSSILNLVIRDTLPGTFQISSTTASCAPFAVTVKYTSGGSLQTKWDFGDGTISLGDSVVHTYTLPGIYNLRMYVKENVGGCISMASQQVTVGGVSGSFTYQNGFACLNSPVSFKGVSSNANLYKYIFGDGDSLTTSTTPVLHSFKQPGYYFPSIVLMNGSCSLKLTGADTIKVDMGKPGFLINTQYVCASTSIQFTDTSFSYFGIKSFAWNFGDGSPVSTIQSPAHTYTTSGTYYIALQTIGISGCTDTVTVPLAITVHNFPASFIGGDSVACTNQPMALIANVQSIDSIQTPNWTFGNNTTGSGINVKAIYNNIGTYSIRLISRTIFGCTDTAYKTVKVNITPTVFAGADVTICKGQSVQIMGTGASKLTWFPTQGLSCVTCASPVATPSFTTNYYVVGTNSAGCSAADTVIVNVVQPLVLNVSANDTICIGNQAQLSATNAYSYIWNPATGLSNSRISNPIASPNITTKYRVIGTDASNCFSDTGYVVVAVGQYPVVKFGSNGGVVTAGTAIQLTPTIANGPIINYRWTPTQDLSCTNCANPIATINNNVTYILQVENNYGCKGSDTISYRVNCASSQVFIANAFSPDGDGVNDILFVQGKGISIVKYFRIFNRWGQMVFERNNFNINDPSTGWDGKVNGVLANTDVFVFTAEVLCTAGSTFVYKGNVTLVR